MELYQFVPTILQKIFFSEISIIKVQNISVAFAIGTSEVLDTIWQRNMCV